MIKTIRAKHMFKNIYVYRAKLDLNDDDYITIAIIIKNNKYFVKTTDDTDSLQFNNEEDYKNYMNEFSYLKRLL